MSGATLKRVNRALEEDINKRAEDDPVKIAYHLAEKCHAGQKRKGVDENEQITHAVRVYDLVSRCLPRGTPDRDLVLSASLLHDAVEDYRKDDIKSKKITAQDARAECIKKIKSAFSDSDNKFAEKLVALVGEVTNPPEFKNAKGEIIEKKEWQVEHVRHISNKARLIKICDQAMNVVSNIEEVPQTWDYKQVVAYENKATAVVKSIMSNIKEFDEYLPAVRYAGRIYDKAAEECREILADMQKDGVAFPPKHSIASISLKNIMQRIKMEDEKSSEIRR